MAIYRVTQIGTNKVRLVEAPINSAALRHVAADTFTVAVAKPREIAEMVAMRVALEEYGKSPQADLPLPEPAGEVLQEKQP